MPKFSSLQESFAAGEISPLLHGRMSTEGYKSGAKAMLNMFPNARGPAVGRRGALFIGEFDGANGKVFDISIEDDGFFVGVLTDKRLRMFDAEGEPLTTNLLSNPIFSEGTTGWAVDVSSAASSITFNNRNCYLEARPIGAELITEPNFDNAGAGWIAQNDGTSSVVFTAGLCTLSPEQGGGVTAKWAGISQLITPVAPGSVHSVEVKGNFNVGDAIVRVGLTEGSSELLNTVITANAVLDFTPVGPVWVTVQCEKPEFQVQLTEVSVLDPTPGYASMSQAVTGLAVGDNTLVIHLNDPATLHVQVGTGVGDGTYMDVIQTAKDAIYTVTVPATTATLTLTADSTANVSLEVVAMSNPDSVFDKVTPWDEGALHDIHQVPLVEKDEIHFLHGDYPPQRLTYEPSTKTWAFGAVPTGKFPPNWMSSGNYPRTGTFYVGRLWYGGTADNPQKFWGSASLDDLNFIVPTSGAVGTDPIAYTIQKFGAIRWMEGTKTLLIGTSHGEYTIFTSKNFADVAELPDIQQQSAYGSSKVQPVVVGDQVFYVSPDNTKIRALQYEWSADNWLSNDLTFFSEHLTRPGIVDMGWQQNPGNVLWCTLANGEIATLVYQRDQNIWGWSHINTQGDFISATSAEHGGSHFFVALAQRVPGKMYLEYQAVHSDAYFDSYAVKDDAVATDVLSGLDHLEGFTVQVLVDDVLDPNSGTAPLATHPDRVVVGGQITLQGVHKRAMAGLQYISRLHTLPPDAPSQTGTQVADHKHHSDIYVKVHNTYGILVNGQRPPDRQTVTPMNQREPNKIEYVRVNDIGWDRDGGIVIEQPLPLPITVTQIVAKTTFEDT